MVHQSMYRLTGKNVTNITFYVLFALLTYFIWCDISFYTDLAEEQSVLLLSNKTRVVSRYSVKLRMLTHFDQYVYLPTCRWLNENLGISELPWMSPNLVTFMHFTIAVCCGRFFASSHLVFRRIACIMFEVRSCLDVMDGVVYRAQHKTTTLVSGWGSMGYWIDGMADVLGSFFIILGTIYRWNICPPINDRPKANKYKEVKDSSDIETTSSFLSPSDNGKGAGDTSQSVERHSRKHVLKICFLITLSVIVRSRMWDYFIQSYHELLGVQRTDISSRQQLEILNFPSTWLCMWLWRFTCADQFLTFSLIAIFLDKLWAWMTFSVKAAIPNLVIFGALCQLHLMYVRTYLDS